MSSNTVLPSCLLIEDDAFVQKELTFFLSDLGFSVTCASTYEEALRLLHASPPFRLAVVDLRLRRDGERRPMSETQLGLDLTAHIKRTAPATAVVIWTSYDDQVAVIAGMAAQGWFGLAYAVKGSEPEELRVAINHALRGDLYFQRGLQHANAPDLAARFLRALSPELATLVAQIADQMELLSPKEREVIERLPGSTESIAHDMGVTPHRVRNHLDTIYTRLQLKDAPATTLRRDSVLVLAALLRRLQTPET